MSSPEGNPTEIDLDNLSSSELSEAEGYLSSPSDLGTGIGELIGQLATETDAQRRRRLIALIRAWLELMRIGG